MKKKKSRFENGFFTSCFLVHLHPGFGVAKQIE